MIGWIWLACVTPSSHDSDTGGLADSFGPLSHEEDIQPIWSETCLEAGCHDREQGRVVVLDPAEAHDNLVDRASDQFPLFDLVEPGNPDGSYLFHKLAGTHTSVGGMGRPMPADLDPLPADIQAMVRAWILQGAPP